MLNTIASGGFGLAGTYLVPRSQREARASDARRAKQAIIRDKATDLFRELGALRSNANPALISGMKSLLTDGNEPNVIPMMTDDKVRSIVAVYFPSLFPIIDKYRDELRRGIEPANEQFSEMGSLSDPKTLPAVKRASITVLFHAAAYNQKLADELEKELLALTASQPFE